MMEPVELSMKWKSLLKSNELDNVIAYNGIYQKKRHYKNILVGWGFINRNIFVTWKLNLHNIR